MHRSFIAVILSTTAAFAIGAQPACPTFTPATWPSDLAFPIVRTAADFNGDGRDDLAVTAYNEGQLQILLASADGSLQAKALYFPKQTRVHAVVAADANGDGHLDLIAGTDDSFGAGLRVLLGNGDGSFAIGMQRPLALPARQLVSADMDGDGILDVVAGPSPVFFRGQGNGSFEAPVSIDPYGSYSDIDVADFDGDGRPDVAGVSALAWVTLIYNRGNGTFSTPVTFVVEEVLKLHFLFESQAKLAAADVDLDGHPDLALALDIQDNVILRNRGDGTFAFARFTRAGGSAIAFRDFNGDGRPDLVTLSSATFSIELANGDGTFGLPQRIRIAPDGAFPTGPFALGDFRGIGRSDVAIGVKKDFTEGIQIYRNDCAPAPLRRPRRVAH
ncbi:MAG TPA: VCBS repeat-containing protein [Thermoanaerobaculia bacterium]|nr:VCBS repeat-containing protein [Thermoanaerobaculia bacterium]